MISVCAIDARSTGRKETGSDDRFASSQTPRQASEYLAIPFDHVQAKEWIERSKFYSLTRTTELIAAISSGMGIALSRSDVSMSLRQGDEALLISLSYGVLLASAQGEVIPLPEDWRFSLLLLESSADLLGSELVERVTEDVLPGQLA